MKNFISIILILCVCLFVHVKCQRIQTKPNKTIDQIRNQLNTDLSSFVEKKKKNGTRLENRPVNRGNRLNNMRQTTDNAKNITDISNFTIDFVTNSNNLVNDNLVDVTSNRSIVLIKLDPTF